MTQFKVFNKFIASHNSPFYLDIDRDWDDPVDIRTIIDEHIDYSLNAFNYKELHQLWIAQYDAQNIKDLPQGSIDD